MSMNLPLVKYATKSFEGVDLKETVIIGAQHLLGTTLDLFQHLFSKGLKPQNTFLIGKCYSSSRHVGRSMLKAGIYVCPSSFKFLSHLPFDEQYADNMRAFIEEVLPKVRGAKSIIFLDDGAYLIKMSHKILSDFSGVFGVEQTSSGYEALKNFNLKFPVINVARSMAKLKYESPMIAEVVASHIYKSLDILKLKGRKALIIGGGAVGSSIFQRIKADFDVKIFDSQEQLSMLENGNFSTYLAESDLIIGCTGTTVLGPESYKLLKKGVFLISASSSDREFDAVNFRRKCKSFKNPHKNVQVNDIHLLNSGFPINFDGHKHSVPANLIQLTRALLACGVLQALTEDSLPNTLIELDIELQRNIVRKFLIFCAKELNALSKKIPSNFLASTHT